MTIQKNKTENFIFGEKKGKLQIKEIDTKDDFSTLLNSFHHIIMVLFIFISKFNLNVHMI